MIEDKELGLKIAEDPIELLWINTKEETEKTIKNIPNLIKKLGEELIINEAIRDLAISKLKEFEDGRAKK